MSLFSALAETIVPPGRAILGANAETVSRLETALVDIHPSLAPGWRTLGYAVDAYALARTGRRFESLPLGRRLQLLHALDRRESTRNLLRGLVAPLKLAALDDPAQHAALGCRYEVERPAQDEPARWRQGVVAGAELAGEAVDCDVVVVGSGAGGAPLAARLAEAGLGVLILEEGEHHTRRDFSGRPVDMMRRLYRKGGATLAVGNTIIPIPLGKGVGGTTTINSGTCFRLPSSTRDDWRRDAGVSLGDLDHYYDLVATDLEIAPSSREAIGRAGELVARGCEALGWRHHALARNAPGCDGQGLCVFGCPTDAKRSTNVSYVPRALAAGATCATGARVHRVLIEQGRAVGVEASTSAGPLRVRARAVVLACGTLHTPALLLALGLGNSSDQVGRNLSIHPATASMGVFDESVAAFASVPQGYGISEFHDEGLLFEGSSLPLEITAAMTPGLGPSWTALMDEAQHTLLFGFLVKDSSRGRVTVARDGSPRVRYWLNRRDTGRVHRGLELLARCFFAAGARAVVQPAMGHERLSSPAALDQFRRARMAARHFDLTAYHPVGTCRMGRDPARSVVNEHGAVHDVPGLSVVDASIFAGSPGVNPQWTIMALALRAGDHLAAKLAEAPRA